MIESARDDDGPSIGKSQLQGIGLRRNRRSGGHPDANKLPLFSHVDLSGRVRRRETAFPVVDRAGGEPHSARELCGGEAVSLAETEEVAIPGRLISTTRRSGLDEVFDFHASSISRGGAGWNHARGHAVGRLPSINTEPSGPIHMGAGLAIGVGLPAATLLSNSYSHPCLLYTSPSPRD